MFLAPNIGLYKKSKISSFFEVSWSQRLAEFSELRKDPELKLRLLNLLPYISMYLINMEFNIDSDQNPKKISFLKVLC